MSQYEYGPGYVIVSDDEKQLPQIKPLVWVDVFDTGFLFRAETPFGNIYISQTDPSRFEVDSFEEEHDCKTLVEAKSWCEQEYERRVRECLEL